MTAPSQSTRAALARPRALQALRVLGWVLIVAGVVVLLYVVYALWFTGFETEQAQQELHQRWEQQVVDADGARGPPPSAAAEEVEEPEGDADQDGAAVPGEAVAKLEFERPGSDQRPVSDEPLFVVDDVDREALTRGPGHYPDTAGPGEDGNFAVAGHRTTYGSPFFSLEELSDGDEIHITDRSGREHVYEFAAREIVSPGERWVLAEDPLDTERPTVTLTTCHPRFSAAQRMVVFGELVG